MSKVCNQKTKTKIKKVFQRVTFFDHLFERHKHCSWFTCTVSRRNCVIGEFFATEKQACARNVAELFGVSQKLFRSNRQRRTDGKIALWNKKNPNKKTIDVREKKWNRKKSIPYQWSLSCFRFQRVKQIDVFFGFLVFFLKNASQRTKKKNIVINWFTSSKPIFVNKQETLRRAFLTTRSISILMEKKVKHAKKLK